MWDSVAILARDIPPLCDKTVRAWLPKADKHYLMAGQVPTSLLTNTLKTPINGTLNLLFNDNIFYQSSKSKPNINPYVIYI